MTNFWADIEAELDDICGSVGFSDWKRTNQWVIDSLELINNNTTIFSYPDAQKDLQEYIRLWKLPQLERGDYNNWIILGNKLKDSWVIRSDWEEISIQIKFLQEKEKGRVVHILDKQ